MQVFLILTVRLGCKLWNVVFSLKKMFELQFIENYSIILTQSQPQTPASLLGVHFRPPISRRR